MPQAPEPAGPAYTEHAPHPSLERHVECYWMTRARLAAGDTHHSTVLPDGCMDILFGLGDVVARSSHELADPWVVGTMTRPVDVTHQGVIDLVGVRFRPGGASAFLQVTASELTDRVAPLDDLWGPAAHVMRDRLAEASDIAARVALLDRLLADRLRETRVAGDEQVLATSELVAASGGNVSVDALADASGLSRRQLERRFLAAVGTPPKVAARIARFRRALSRLHGDPAADLARLALECGYSDQAHFTRDFKSLAGIPPGQYRDGLTTGG